MRISNWIASIFGKRRSSQDVGTDDTIDSDADATGVTAIIPLAFTDHLTNIDAGFIDAGDACGSGGSG